MSYVLCVGIGIIIGIYIVKEVENEKWMDNSSVPYRVYKKGRFFKVVEIESQDSWRMADVHRIKKHGQEF